MKTHHLRPEAAAQKLKEWATGLTTTEHVKTAESWLELADQVCGLNEPKTVILPKGELLQDHIELRIDPDAPDVREIEIYLHSSKESNWDLWETLGGKDNKAGRRFSYVAYEVELGCTVNMDTGECSCFALNDIRLEEPVKLS